MESLKINNVHENLDELLTRIKKAGERSPNHRKMINAINSEDINFIYTELLYRLEFYCENKILNYPAKTKNEMVDLIRKIDLKTLVNSCIKKYTTVSLNESEAASKSQRRLFAMALAYKNGKLDSKYATEHIKKLSKLDEDKLREFASTKELKRKKDGSIGKRNAIPEKVKKEKKKKTSKSKKVNK